jgi:hypothetical protein
VIVALWAALAMFTQDLLAVPLVQCEAAYRAHASAMLDTAGWLVSITTTFISVKALGGHNTDVKDVVILGVSAANYWGTYTGVQLGKRLRKPDPDLVALKAFMARAIELHPDLA